jgi:DNA-binding transcriptional LysR family regulator
MLSAFAILQPFLTLYPKLQLDIQISENLPAFEREQVDIAIGFALPTAIVRRHIMTTCYVPHLATYTISATKSLIAYF